MTTYINPGLVKTNRRNVLRGSLLAGAAAAVGGAALAPPRLGSFRPKLRLRPSRRKWTCRATPA